MSIKPKYDPILRELRESDNGGVEITGDVETYELLPDASNTSGQYWIIKTSTGEWFIDRKEAGLYLSDGITYNRLGEWEQAFQNIVYETFIPQTTPPSHVEGRQFYDSTKKAISYYNDEPEVTVNVGQEVIIPVYNNSGATITNGSVVYPSGVNGDKHTIGLADACIEAKCRLVAVATHDIENNTSGYVTRLGSVGGIDTSLLSGILYLSDTIPGSLTMDKPIGGSFVIPIGSVKENGVNGSITVDPYISELTVEVTDTNGFSSDQRTNTSLSFENATRTLSISAASYPFHYYMVGYKYQKDNTDSVSITDVEGRHYIYYDEETLKSIENPNEGQTDQLIRKKCLVCSLYWDASANEIVGAIQDERHGISMAPDTHSYNHFTRGAQYLSGLGLGDLDADNNSPNDASGQFSVGSGITADEDLITVYQQKISTSGLPIYYLEGTNGDTRRIIEDGFSVLTDLTAGVGVTGRLVYNEYTGSTWQLTTVDSGDFVLCHIFAINGTGDANGDEEVDQQIAVIGQNQYLSAADARLGATTEISSIISGLAAPEIVPLATVIFKTKNNYTNSSILSRVVSTADGDYTDWRTSEIQSGATASSHTNLTNVDTAANGIIQGHVNNSVPLQMPSLTSIERDAFALPISGMVIWNETTIQTEVYNGTSWIAL